MRPPLVIPVLAVVAFGVGFAIDQVALEGHIAPAITAKVVPAAMLAQAGTWYNEDGSISAYQTPYEPASSYNGYGYYGYYESGYQSYYQSYYQGYYEPYYGTVYVTPTPWYVTAFPGIGQMAQQIIPGQSNPIRVTAPTPTPVKNPQPTCWISANPTQVTAGGSSALSWSSFNATRATLSDVGDVALTGSQTVRNISSTQNFTLQVSGAGGSNICYTRVNVTDAGPPPSCVISVFPSAISRGQSASLSWGSLNATVATLGGVGVVELQGGRSVFPAYSSDYSLTVGDASGRQNTCTAHLTVQ